MTNTCAVLALLFIGLNFSVSQKHDHVLHSGKRIIPDPNSTAATTGNNNNRAYKCSVEEKQFQFDNIDLVWTHICEPFGMMTPWQLTQMIYPDIHVFFDIGANRGYTAAEFFALWSPGHNITRINLHKALQFDANRGLLSNDQQINTYCRDGLKEDKTMICIGRYNGPCLTRRPITVYSFDGQRTHVEDTNGTVARHFPHLLSNYTIDPAISSTKATWVYTRAAMTDTIPPGETHGYFQVVHHEGGRLIKSQKSARPGTDLVPLLTVDLFCEQNNINNVPILKIDAEGHDIQVLKGAKQTLLSRGVKVVNLECWDCMSDAWQKAYQSLNIDYGFDCYGLGQFNVYVRLTDCWDYSVSKLPSECNATDTTKRCPDYYRANTPKKRLDGNTMCIHRKRGSRLHAMFEQMSLYKFYNTAERGDVHKDALLANLKARYDDLGRIIATPREAEDFKNRFGRNITTGLKEWLLQRRRF